MEKFSLKWNDFENNIGNAFNDLREEKDFFDVTLACEDSQLEAHKVVLSACSPFFKTILRRNPHQHPLVYLKGVKYRDLSSLLNFMYKGQVNIAQEELNTFLSVAEELQVKGLTQGGHPRNLVPPPKLEKVKSQRHFVPEPSVSKRSPVRQSSTTIMPKTVPAPVNDDIKSISVEPTPSSDITDIDITGEDEDVPINVVDNDPPTYSATFDAGYIDPEIQTTDQQGSMKEKKLKDFCPRVKNVMSLSQQKLQCLLCYKKFSTKDETAEHMKARHRITLAGAIDKSMRSVFS